MEASGGGKYAGMSKGQIKKAKEKEKKEAAAAALAAELGEAGVEVPKEEAKEEAKTPTTPATPAAAEGEGESAGGKYAGMSKAQIKKAKAKEKAEREAAEAKEEKKAEPAEPAPGKKLTVRQQKALEIRQRQEEAKRIQDEIDAENKRFEEEENARLAKIKEEQEAAAKKAANKKAEREAKIAEMKAAGTYLTKKQLEQKKAAEARRKAMFGDEDPGQTPADGEQKKISYKSKKKPKKEKAEQVAETKPEEKKAEAEAEEDEEEEEKVEKKPEEKKQVVKEVDLGEDDDWENMVDEIADVIADAGADKVVSKAEDDSEDSQEEEPKEKVQKKTGPKKAVPTPGSGKQSEGSSNAFGGSQDKEARARQEALRKKKIEEKKRQLKEARSKKAKLRCPVVCIMGHVDTGKTLILDKLRKTKVQAGEAGGITQQIGATYFPELNLQNHLDQTHHWEPEGEELSLELPGFLVIDTPGHESFSNLRSRGSSLCDLAVLVVDIMHGMEPQTLESLRMLKDKGTPFCIALNKIDRLNSWQVNENVNSRDTMAKQNANAQNHFDRQWDKVKLAFAEEGFNTALYWENDSPEDTLSLVPTSAITGEGLSDLVTNLCRMGQTTEREKLTERPDNFECTVLEVKVIEGHGTTIDVVLVNGLLKVQDTIVVSGLNGPIETKIRALLTPYPMKEMRVKGEYQHHAKIKGAMGIKISAPGLEHAIAGSELFLCKNEQEIQDAKDNIEGDMIDILEKYVDKTKEGVCVQASTIGSLEALLEFLHVSKVPVSAVNIGPVHRKDVMKAMKSVGTDKMAQVQKNKEFATVLAFDVRVMPDAQAFAEENGIKVFTAKIIYHLFDDFTEYLQQCKQERKGDLGTKAVFPCILEMVKDACFNQKNPIIIGAKVVEGILKVGTPLCVPDRDCLKLGVVQSIESNKKPIQQARTATGDVAIKIVSNDGIMYGRHFDDKSQICSLITRDSIDALKEFFRDDMQDDDWRTCIKLKKIYEIN